MAADLYRVVRDRVSTDGVLRTIASEPIGRTEAMARFDACVTIGLDRVRVIREADYQPALFGPQNQAGVYRGGAE
jgi:hypothetical protein